MKVHERFLEYVMWNTQADRSSQTIPSSPGQIDFAQYLVGEIKALGIDTVHMDEKGYVYGMLPANSGADSVDVDKAPIIGFLAHVDTSDAHPGPEKAPRIVSNYDGGRITLENGIVLDPAVDARFLKCVGHDLIVTDGNTLLGGDDKAGIAEIITALEYLVDHPEIPHGNVAFGFTPDEEIGRSQNYFDVEAFGADFAYTVDGGQFGEIEYENFYAASAEVIVNGVTMYPGSGKNKMKNAAVIAVEYNQYLPPWERPEHTEGYEGYFHLVDINGNCEHGILNYNIREFDQEKFRERKELMLHIADILNRKYGKDTVKVKLTDGYRNMAEKVRPHMHLIDFAAEAVKELGHEPIINPARGGTDGAELSYKGVPCPNMGTGNFAAHSVREVTDIQQMELVTQLILKLIIRYGNFIKK